VTVQEVSSWESWKAEFSKMKSEKSVLNTEDRNISSLLFRGHRRVSWKLKSTLERKVADLPTVNSFAKQIKVTKLAFESYTGSSWQSAFTSSDVALPPEDYEFMVYLRHHGYPIPLLDWSRSPYIASFFAFQYPSTENNVAVYSFREYSGEGKSGKINNSNIVGCGPTIRTHKRHYIQQAEYTYCRKKVGKDWHYSSHEQALAGSGADQDTLKKYVLPASIRGEVLTELDSMNINAYTLFGSEEGLAEMLANREYGYD